MDGDQGVGRLPFGVLLRSYRLAVEMTQEELAARAGISARSISGMESGAHHRPRKDTLRLLIAALNLTPLEADAFVTSARVSHLSRDSDASASETIAPIGTNRQPVSSSLPWPRPTVIAPEQDVPAAVSDSVSEAGSAQLPASPMADPVAQPQDAGASHLTRLHTIEDSDQKPIQVHLAQDAVRALMRPPTPLVGRDREVHELISLLTNAITPERITSSAGGPPMGGSDHSPMRLLTLHGPPGVGKTRLGIEVLSYVAPTYADGVYLIDLAPLCEPDQLPHAIWSATARSLAHGESTGTDARSHVAFDDVLALLHNRNTLLLLDNFEHMLAAAPLVTDLIAACPLVRVLVTSREALRLRGERTFLVSPLAWSFDGAADVVISSARGPSRNAGSATDAHSVTVATPRGDFPCAPAVALFVDRARDIEPTFVLMEEHAEIVELICRQLDGLPLAIELAAARMRMLPLPELLRRLQHPLSTLTRGPHDAPARQRTLRSTLHWSYDLLTAEEKRLFRYLAIFADGVMLHDLEAIFTAHDQFTRPARQDLCTECAGPGIERSVTPRSSDSVRPVEDPQEYRTWEEPVLDILSGLVEKNLVLCQEMRSELASPRASASDSAARAPAATAPHRGEQPLASTVRVRFLATVHEYAEELLQQLGEVETLAAAHAIYFLALAEQAEPQLRGEAQLEWMARLQAERHNFRAALRWFSCNNLRSEGLRLAAALRWVWIRDGMLKEGRTWLETFLSGVSASGREASATSATAALDRASSVAAEDTVPARHSGTVLSADGGGSSTAQTVPQAQGACEADDRYGPGRAARPELASDTSGGKVVAKALHVAGVLAYEQGDYNCAVDLYDESLALHRSIGDQRGTLASLNNLAIVAVQRGEFMRALPLYKEILAVRRELRDEAGIASVLTGLGAVTYLLGNYEGSQAFHRESLDLKSARNDRYGRAISLQNLAVIALQRGEFDKAEALAEESLALAREFGAPSQAAAALDTLGALWQLKGDFTRAQVYFTESAELYERGGSAWGRAESYASRARLACDMDEISMAEDLYRCCLESCRELRLRHLMATCLEGLAWTASRHGSGRSPTDGEGQGRHAGGQIPAAASWHGKPWPAALQSARRSKAFHTARQGEAPRAESRVWIQQAVRLWGAAATLRQELSYPRRPTEEERYQRAVTSVRAMLGGERFAYEWAEGETMSLEAALETALRTEPARSVPALLREEHREEHPATASKVSG